MSKYRFKLKWFFNHYKGDKRYKIENVVVSEKTAHKWLERGNNWEWEILEWGRV